MKHFRNFTLMFTIVSLLSSIALEIGNYESRTVSNILWVITGILVILYLILVIIGRKKSKYIAMPEQEDIEYIEVSNADIDDLHWISNLEKSAYPEPMDQMPYDKLKEWYDKNPNCFWIVKANGERIGNMYLFPLIPQALNKLRNGEILERELTAKDIYSSKQRNLINSLHICSLVARKDLPVARKTAATLLKTLPKIITALCDPARLETIYALAASKPGMNLITNYRFTEICNAEARKDKHPMFSVHFKDLAEEISKKRLSEQEERNFKKLLGQLRKNEGTL